MKSKKFRRTIKQQMLSRKESVNYRGETVKSLCITACLENLSLIRPGMFFYHDNTFSTERLFYKKLKMVVDYVENDIIYGDLTVSELCDISEQEMSYYDAKNFIENFSYPCQDNEQIVLYSIRQMDRVYENYDSVSNTFANLGKKARGSNYWSSTDYDDSYAWYLDFRTGHRGVNAKYYDWLYVRPVLALKVY